LKNQQSLRFSRQNRVSQAVCPLEGSPFLEFHVSRLASGCGYLFKTDQKNISSHQIGVSELRENTS
jgi:hypothetical protein